MSGLAAGIRLAQFDRRVAILERHTVWGGLNSFYGLAGRRFDVGLHALTNYVPARTRDAPLTRLLRQLRLRHADLRLGEQHGSAILFPETTLRFANDPALLEAEVERAFPAARDGFRRLVAAVRAFEPREAPAAAAREPASARAELRRLLGEPRLAEMLLLPVLYYGSASEDDVDWRQFAILFRGIFLEGLARPAGGIRTLLNLLVKRYRSLGGELRMGAGVRRVVVAGGAARGVELDDGEVLECDRVLSSAGWVETMRLCGAAGERLVRPEDAGRLSFLESISVLDRQPAELGIDVTTAFFAEDEEPRYRRPDGLSDARSGVVSVPNHFGRSDTGAAGGEEGVVRVSLLADHDRWAALDAEAYAREKARAADAGIAAAARWLPDWRPHTVFRDVFTPLTIRRFTGHVNGAVYGSPRKHVDGETGIEGLALCGTDQGYLGVIGALISGVTMANRHVLTPLRGAPA